MYLSLPVVPEAVRRVICGPRPSTKGKKRRGTTLPGPKCRTFLRPPRPRCNIYVRPHASASSVPVHSRGAAVSASAARVINRPKSASGDALCSRLQYHQSAACACRIVVEGAGFEPA
jgi:hypothetical protein